MSGQSELFLAIKQIAAERKIEFSEIVEAIKKAIKHGYLSEFTIEDPDFIDVEMNAEEGYIAVFMNKTVADKVKDKVREISLEDAKKIKAKAKVGEVIPVDVTNMGDFGRIAAQSARQIIMQNLRESEKEAAISEMKSRVGGIDTVRVQKITAEGDVICELGRARAVMPKEERIGSEFYKLGAPVKVFLKSIEEDSRGKFILVSRADPGFLKALFAIEVPEIDSGTIEIIAIAREEGSRSKVAVTSHSSGVDPIGSCVGQKGVRINAIMNELSMGRTEEKVDIILWDEDVQHFIKNSLSPAEVISVKVDSVKKKAATVIVPNEQYSLAIGRDGQNARLASKLTGYEIDIQPETPLEEKKEEIAVEEVSTENVEEVE